MTPTIGHYRDGSTFVTWCSVAGKRWETVSETAEQVSQDEATAYQFTLIPAIVGELQEVEILIDAAIHPVFDMDAETMTALITDAHNRLRKLMGMPAIVEGVAA